MEAVTSKESADLHACFHSPQQQKDVSKLLQESIRGGLVSPEGQHRECVPDSGVKVAQRPAQRGSIREKLLTGSK